VFRKEFEYFIEHGRSIVDSPESVLMAPEAAVSV
jgi:hypothetical protein